MVCLSAGGGLRGWMALCLFLFFAPLKLCNAQCFRSEPGQFWYRGQTHTHSLRTDADAAPEYVYWRYRQMGYNFVYLIDHNRLQDGEDWVPIREDGKLTNARVESYREVFGEDWFEFGIRNGTPAMRLNNFEKLSQLNVPDKFLCMQGSEVTPRRVNVHISALNLQRLVNYNDYSTTWTNANATIAQIRVHGQFYGVPTVAVLNHPNYVDGIIDLGDIMNMPDLRLMEIYNGHYLMRTWGDEEIGLPSVIELWDRVLTARCLRGDKQPMWGVAADDAHHYWTNGPQLANPGRGWIVVQAAELTPDAITRAIDQGKFYASTGVQLESFEKTALGIKVKVKAEEGVTYRIAFVGTRRNLQIGKRPLSGPEFIKHVEEMPVGERFYETTENPATYNFRGDELYVRVRVLSSRLHPNPAFEGIHERAWTQPVYLTETMAAGWSLYQ
jgi:hypothetical protein